MPVALIVALVLALLTAVFALQNATVVTVTFLAWSWEASLALVLIFTVAVGILIGYLAGLPSKFKKGGELRQAKRDLAEVSAAQTESESTVAEDESV